jgi:hypothetical protein
MYHISFEIKSYSQKKTSAMRWFFDSIQNAIIAYASPQYVRMLQSRLQLEYH